MAIFILHDRCSKDGNNCDFYYTPIDSGVCLGLLAKTSETNRSLQNDLAAKFDPNKHVLVNVGIEKYQDPSDHINEIKIMMFTGNSYEEIPYFKGPRS